MLTFENYLHIRDLKNKLRIGRVFRSKYKIFAYPSNRHLGKIYNYFKSRISSSHFPQIYFLFKKAKPINLKRVTIIYIYSPNADFIGTRSILNFLIQNK